MKLNLIAACDKNWAIGKDNGLLFSIPQDMKHFRELTSGHVVVMGRNTLESFPGKKPLKNRTNIVLSGRMEEREDCFVVRGLDQLFEKLKEFDDEIFVIGGAEVYRQLLPYCEQAYITKVDEQAEADRFFPDLDNTDGWEVIEAEEPFIDNGHSIMFCTYKNNKTKVYNS